MAESESGLRSGHIRRMIAIWGMLICGLGFLASAGAYFWPAEETKAETAILTADGNWEKTKLYIECSYYAGTTVKVPASGVLSFLDFSPEILPSLTFGFNKFSNQPRGDYILPGERDKHVCTISNFGSEPIRDLIITMRIIYKNIAKEYKFDNSNAIAQRDYSAIVDLIDTKPNNSFTFYVLSRSEYFGFVELLDDVRYKNIGTENIIEGKLTYPTSGFANRILLTANVTIPPALPPPVPKTPSKPKAK